MIAAHFHDTLYIPPGPRADAPDHTAHHLCSAPVTAMCIVMLITLKFYFFCKRK